MATGRPSPPGGATAKTADFPVRSTLRAVHPTRGFIRSTRMVDTESYSLELVGPFSVTRMTFTSVSGSLSRVNWSARSLSESKYSTVPAIMAEASSTPTTTGERSRQWARLRRPTSCHVEKNLVSQNPSFIGQPRA